MKLHGGRIIDGATGTAYVGDARFGAEATVVGRDGHDDVTRAGMAMPCPAERTRGDGVVPGGRVVSEIPADLIAD